MSKLMVAKAPLLVSKPRKGQGPLNAKLKPLTERILDSITDQMNAAVKNGWVIGWSASVSHADGSGHFHNAGGHALIPLSGNRWSGRRPGLPMTPQSVAQLGSVSKTITAMAAIAAVLHRNPHAEPDPALFDVPVAHFLPSKDFDTSQINGTKSFPKKMLVSHLLDHWSYFPKNVEGVRSTQGGYYENLRMGVKLGPDPVPNSPVKFLDLAPPFDYGEGPGRYSNMGYELMRVVTALLGERSPGYYNGRKDRHERDYQTAVAYRDYAQQALEACGVYDATVRGSPEVRYYNADSKSPDKDEYVDDADYACRVGAGGWRMSVEGIRKLLVGAQQGTPFKNNPGWWKKVMTTRYFGMDPPHLHLGDDAYKRFDIKGTKVPFYRKGGAQPGGPRGAVGHAEWQVTADGVTLAIQTNSSSQSAPSLKNVLAEAYRVGVEEP